mmetsp:Transcript_13860/g.35925  ORF Transcript_13860/g.35925 Transcript_13860/m.35925 type:complete len:105 (-) Transcript_13860:246-560(-)
MCAYEYDEPGATPSTESAAMVEMVGAMPNLLWLYAGFMGSAPLGVRAIEALPSGLHALAYDVIRPRPPAEHIEALRAAPKRMPSLKWLHVQPTNEGKSSVPLRR